LEHAEGHGAAALASDAGVGRGLGVFAAADVAAAEVPNGVDIEDAAAVAAVQHGKELVRGQTIQPRRQIIV
jgi:hypothetical protein